MTILIIILTVLSSYVIYFLSVQLKHYATRVSFIKTYEKTGLIIITLLQDKQKFNFVVDCGSTVSVFNEQYIDLLKDKKIVYEKTEADTLQGKTETASCIEQTFLGSNGIYTQKFYLFDLSKSFSWSKDEFGEEIHGLLGIDFLVNNNIVIDFDKLNLYKK